MFTSIFPVVDAEGRELAALRAFREQVQAMYDRGGHITRAQVKAALDTAATATTAKT